MKKLILIVSFICSIICYAQEENYSIKNLDVNTEYSDFGVSYFGDSTVIYSSSKRKRTIKKKTWSPNKQPFLELYRGTIDNVEILNSINFSKLINSKFHESNATFTKDLKTVYFSGDNYTKGKGVKRDTTGYVLVQLFMANVNDEGQWTNITKLPFNNDNYSSGHPTLNNKEDKLYFTSNMPGGYGMTDIYVVDIFADGTYGEPQNLGPQVNTKGKEMFPFIDENDVLYFSSDCQPYGFGELDIYATKQASTNEFYYPVNLGTPINSEKDDFAIVYQIGKNKGYFSSNREGGKGDDDIYAFEELTPVKFECHQTLKGTIQNSETNELLSKAKVSLFKDNELIEEFITTENGTFEFAIDCKSNYKITGSKNSFKSDSKEFSTLDQDKLTVTSKLNLIPPPPGPKIDEFTVVNGKVLIKINPIYFDLNKFDIRPDAALELEKVVAIMKKYPELIVEGGSHTDSRGSSKYNETLSARRAFSTVSYIVKRGISADRITSKGYGESELVNRCKNGIKCSKEEHQINRRTEFRIVNPVIIKSEI
ncbi:OmpA family protein [Urechidicola croceus]|uniref:OmpA-like domain-containing protein n=1 Tax=Urechidicola croceus TaxID=1850246 RepID=A0A1D8P8K7_9FLAO|nr:OmpA family protein [Urechidicola croceus]AOW20892.1 hypothetical protein LPB138_09505 [Urechidicola croceus]